MDVDAATRTMIDNIPQRTGRTLEEWFALLDGAAPQRHGEALGLLKSDYGMTHGFANLIARLYLDRGRKPVVGDDLVDAQYAGAKAGLRPIYDRLLALATALGDDVEVAPKKTGVSLRRRKQFALVEAPSASRVRVGLNLRGAAPTERLHATSGMCTHAVDLHSPGEVDDELHGWLADAYERA